MGKRMGHPGFLLGLMLTVFVALECSANLIDSANMETAKFMLFGPENI
jgi:hypothetical protein